MNATLPQTLHAVFIFLGRLYGSSPAQTGCAFPARSTRATENTKLSKKVIFPVDASTGSG
ncbi:hypothetical protein HK14_06500 [Acetobacter cibinongensis]|uniref:Uncharacterized protein n=1 Tax=Acetobacter cibinongensis TaxID=146475 RepID=A0A1Z5YUL8_9PROT|nr:hypothetical protein HK14_06500 [Acetobacter cibinongensis]